jgi:VIT1/CCC1 family predicted Fe2+/Mn2+ transporter
LLGKENSLIALFGALAYIGSLIPLFIILGGMLSITGLALSVVISSSLQTITLLMLTRRWVNA